MMKMMKNNEDPIHGDVGELLVMQKNLNAPRDEKEDWLRSNTFITMCTIGGKYASLLSAMVVVKNIISQETVSKLKLEVEPHPQPYKLAWAKKGK